MKVSKRTFIWLRILLIAAVPVALLVMKARKGSKSSLGKVKSATQVIYEFAKESGGTVPKKGAKILLGFEPNGEVYLYAYQPSERQAHHGRWSYQKGKMSLKIPDLSVDAQFSLDLSDSNVTMPFQIFTASAGTSQWKASGLPIENGIFAVYYAAMSDSTPNPSQQAAVRRAYDYARARIQLNQPSSPSSNLARRTAEAGLLSGFWLFDGQGASAPDCSDIDEPINVMLVGEDDLLLTYLCGLTIEISLQALDHQGQGPLSLGPLAGDPRVLIDPKSPGDGFSDPPSKTALIISPFTDYDEDRKAGVISPPIAFYSDFYNDNPTPAPDPSKFSIVRALKLAGYSEPKVLLNRNATVEKIAKALIASPNPGVLLFTSHANAGGTFTYDNWDYVDCKDALISFKGFLENLRVSGLGDLVDYKRSHNNLSDTVGYGLLNEGDPQNALAVVTLKPLFWQWAEEKHGVDFHHSLVFMNGCSSDALPDLRNTIQAGAYFAWKSDVTYPLANAVQKYLIASLIRPTHSAEEAFYNLMRIANNHQMIYVEDKFLDGVVGADVWDVHNLNAYAWADPPMDYRSAGWLGTASQEGNHLNAGQVWWILFVERWSQNRDDGKTKIVECWNEFWEKGDPGGLRSPQCQNYKGGSLPTADEVGYATYLLTGTATPGFSGVQVPRWTLNDGRAPDQ